jgi:hypothetical protein
MFSPIWTGKPVAFIPICTLMLEGRTFGKHFGIIYNLVVVTAFTAFIHNA